MFSRSIFARTLEWPAGVGQRRQAERLGIDLICQKWVSLNEVCNLQDAALLDHKNCEVLLIGADPDIKGKFACCHHICPLHARQVYVLLL